MSWKCKKCGHDYFKELKVIEEDVEINKDGFIIFRNGYDISVETLISCRCCHNSSHKISDIADMEE